MRRMRGRRGGGGVSFRWLVGVKGTAKYLKALASGDIASRTDAEARALGCAECASLKRYKIPDRAEWFGAPPFVHTCGPIADPQADPATCGCVMLAQTSPRRAVVTLRGVPLGPGPKAWVASEACTQGRWGRVARVRRWRLAARAWRAVPWSTKEDPPM